MEIVKETSMGLWKTALQQIAGKGEEFLDSNGRISREVLNLKSTILKPETDIEEPINYLRKFDEWIYPSPEEIAGIILNRQLSPAYTYSYGPRVFSFQSQVDQIDEYVIPLLRYDKNSRRAYVSIWNPLEDSKTFKKLVPGMVGIQFRIKSGLLHATALVRSNDFFFGWPANTFQVYTLMKYIAEKTDSSIGTLNTFSLSAHIFKDEMEHIKKLLQ
ncbi:MAG: thymidylate synthase [Candidatus Woesearchaeota archaeon]